LQKSQNSLPEPAGTGVLWTIIGGVPRSMGIIDTAQAQSVRGLSFLQISDSHMGFDNGLWDLSHCLYGFSLSGLSITEIPLGYGIFCSTYDFTVACYL
jgi:hypothetical protein